MSLDYDTRMNLLRSHPAIVARLFDYKQDCIWKYLVMGHAKPFGEVTDYWRRVEVNKCTINYYTCNSFLNLSLFQYQARGTPHVHSLLCISKSDGIDSGTVDSDDIGEQNKVKSYMKGIVSANLAKCVDGLNNRVNSQNNYQQKLDDVNNQNQAELDETDFLWNPSREYFRDKDHPCRVPFDAYLNYERSIDGVFADVNVQRQYRKLQIATQFHRCCFTCFKYCFAHNQVCRFGFPWVSEGCIYEPIIRRDRDKKSRIRVSVLPQRNNANLNGTLHSALISIAHGGNHDIQYIGNSVGAAEYVASYASKAEEPDKKMMANIYAKKIKYIVDTSSVVTDRQRLYAVGCAILGSSPVGAVQACYTLLGLKIVKSSRAVINLNPLHRKLLALFFTLLV